MELKLNKLYLFSGRIMLNGEEVECKDSYLKVYKTSKEDKENRFMHRSDYTLSLGGLSETANITRTFIGLTQTNEYYTGETPDDALADFKKSWVGDGQTIRDGKSEKLSWIKDVFIRNIRDAYKNEITNDELLKAFKDCLDNQGSLRA